MKEADSFDKEAFYDAIGAKNLDEIKMFVSKKYNLNFSFKYSTPLLRAVQTEEIYIIKYLIENGADVNFRDVFDFAPLHEAILSLDIIKLLIENKADINEVACFCTHWPKYTPLSVSVVKNNFDAFKLLIDEGADINEINCDRTTALKLAQKREKTKMLNYYYYGPLGSAIFTENLDKAQQLFEGGADLFTTGANKKTPLIIAVEKGNLEAIKLLFKFGAVLTMQTAFLEAINVGNIEIINFFIQHKVVIDWKYRNGTTPLVKAIEKENFDVVKILIENGANVNLPNNTLLIKAVESGNLDVVKLLIKKGASVNPTDSQDSNPLFESLKLDNSDITKHLISKGAKIEAKYLTENNFQCLRNLISIEVGLKSVLFDDFELFTLAKVVETRNAFFVKYLLDQGLPIDLYDKEQKSPLAIAAKNRSFVIVKVLIEAGADIDSVKEELQECADLNEDFAAYFFKLNLEATTNSFGDGWQEPTE